jgi:hypothetical protein
MIHAMPPRSVRQFMGRPDIGVAGAGGIRCVDIVDRAGIGCEHVLACLAQPRHFPAALAPTEDQLERVGQRKAHRAIKASWRVRSNALLGQWLHAGSAKDPSHSRKSLPSLVQPRSGSAMTVIAGTIPTVAADDGVLADASVPISRRGGRPEGRPNCMCTQRANMASACAWWVPAPTTGMNTSCNG